MKNSIYLAIGNGGGRWSETKDSGIATFRTSDGHIDWDAVIRANRLADGSARNILSQYMAGHTQFGAICSLEYVLGHGWRIGAGVNAQLYHTWERERITDLLGADWWAESHGSDHVKRVGDYVRTDNGKRIHHGTAYMTVSYESRKVKVDLGASVFGSTNQRWDKYNYVGDDVYSDIARGTGESIKGGILYKATRAHSFYLNGGWYSRLPYSNVWFSSGNNEITRGVKNERNILGELGWRMVWDSGNVEFSAYAARWKNRTLMSGKYRSLDADDVRYMITGLDALHKGVEASIYQRIGRCVEFKAFASIGDWRWMNDVSAIIYDDYTGLEAGRVNVYCDGLPVADAPQTQMGANLRLNVAHGFSMGVDVQYNDRMYADFDPSTRNNAEDRATSYRIPGYHLLGADLSWTMSDRHAMNVFLRADNLLDVSYIERGKDGAAHDLESFRGYWGFGRVISFGIRYRL